ncbi:MAG: acyl-CoA dehydrogenase family protein [Syntrophales bacterium]|nr:acyl-CoA dehydrogenase family protein [Syntrophales bacterium]
MFFNPSMKHKALRKALRMFAEAEIGPIARDIDRDARFPWEVIEKMRPLDLFGMQAPKTFGGADMDSISYAIVIEEISRVSAAVGLCLAIHNSICLHPINRWGTDEQKKRFLPEMVRGEKIGAYCMTEAGIGSDVGGVETSATPEGNDYVLNGTKIFVTNGGICGTTLVFATTDYQNPRRGATMFIVDRETPGFIVGEIEDLCGMRANPVSSIYLENCRVPAKNVLGQPGEGVRIGMESLNVGRIGIAAQAMGIAQAAFDDSVLYSKERQQFKKPISSFQTIQNYLADMATDIDAGRLLLYRACAAQDSGSPLREAAAMAKLFCSEMAMRVANKAVQIHGGYGYSKEYAVERYFRDAKVTELYEGTSEVQRIVISREVLAKRV